MKSFLTILLLLAATLFVWVTFRPAGPATASAPATLQGRVVDVIDGDSLKLQAGDREQRIELEGIDAPEIGQAFGEISAYYLTDLLDGRDVSVEISGTNEYGDLVGVVYLETLSVNRQMLTDGYAWAARGHADERTWTGLESLARNKRLGLWREDDPVAPWSFRESREKN